MVPILTATQSRWALSIFVVLLSIVAIGSMTKVVAGGESMYSGRPGDIRGLVVIMGAIGAGMVVMCRIAYLLMPKPWRLYIDRIEFTCVAMLWICWTSATMSFSAFTFGQGVCHLPSSSSEGDTPRNFILPTCPILTFDLALLHLLSTTTLSLLLVILSIALSPGYGGTLSDIKGIDRSDNGNGNGDEEGVLVMWDLAINSPPSSPRLGGREEPLGYGAVEAGPGPGPSSNTTIFEAPTKVDRYASGRIITHGLLLLVSLGVVLSAGLLVVQGQNITTSVFLVVVGFLSLVYAATCLLNHREWQSTKLESGRRSYYRAIEVGSAASLFLLWPLAAISFTMFPSTPQRACDNPASSVSPPDPGSLGSEKSTCLLSLAAITLSWVGAWIVFSRLLGVVFPLPEMKAQAQGRYANTRRERGGEATSLLRSNTNERRGRPQVGYGRIVAGEAFELGDEED